MEDFRTIHGSAHDIPLDDGSVQCIVTSPPYWGLRKYAGETSVEWPSVTFRLNEWVPEMTVAGCDPDCEHEWGNELPPHHPGQVEQTKWKNAEAAGKGQTASSGAYCRKCGGWRGELGLEPDPVAYIAHLILCLREWRRVLRDDGVAWVNLGDSYSGRGKGGNPVDSPWAGFMGNGDREKAAMPNRAKVVPPGLKPKDLCGIPWLFAMAARADGWWLRSDVIWAKPNPMPESVTDRPTSAHEHVFLLAKSQRYYYDADAVREPVTQSSIERSQYGWNGNVQIDDDGKERRSQPEPTDKMGDRWTPPAGRNLRNVWHIATQPTPFAHFAAYPEKLVEPCIRAGTSARGCCPECGAPWERVTERNNESNWAQRVANGAGSGSVYNGHNASHGAGVTHDLPARETTTIGWRPTCACTHGVGDFHDDDRPITQSVPEPVPCVVLDPFSGSGTTGVVAVRERRRYVGVDMSEEYLGEVTQKRLEKQAEKDVYFRKYTKSNSDSTGQISIFDIGLP